MPQESVVNGEVLQNLFSASAPEVSMNRCRRKHSPVQLLILVFSVTTVAGCAEEDTTDVGQQLDTPPFVDYEDIVPSPDVVISVDRNLEQVVNLGLSGVRDWNVSDEIVYEYAVLMPLGPMIVASGILVESPSQGAEDYSTYEAISADLASCSVEIATLASSSMLPVRLRLMDAIDHTGSSDLGVSDYIVDVTWTLVLLEACP